MNYLWEQFNIKTFPSETIVFQDGVYKPNLSTTEDVENLRGLPIHIIYVGEISGHQSINIDIIPGHRSKSKLIYENTGKSHNIKITAKQNQKIFLTVKSENKFPAFLNIFIKNAGNKCFLRGNILIQNHSELTVNNHGIHYGPNTGIIINTKIVAHENSISKLTGIAEIKQGCEFCESDIGFCALAATSARIEFTPKQLIAAAPLSAEHSASLYRPTAPQIEYLRTAGLSSAEIKNILRDAFINDTGDY